MGTSLRAVGFSTGGSSNSNTTVFVELSEFGRIHDDRVSYVLTGLDPGADPEAVADRIEAEVGGVTAQTREQFADSEARIVTDMSVDLLRLMSSIGLVIALAVIALGLMTATLNRLRDFAVLKALGARTPRLARAVAMQVLLTVVLAAAVATTAALTLAWLLHGSRSGGPDLHHRNRGRANHRCSASGRPGRRPVAASPHRRPRRGDRLPGDPMNSTDNTSAASAPDRAGNPGLTAGTKASSSRESRRAPVLTVRGLTKTYGSGETAVDAVRSVDLDATPGEVLLVMGPSGRARPRCC